MKTARFAGHHEATQAVALSIAGVTAIMLIANLMLLILGLPCFDLDQSADCDCAAPYY